MAPEQMKSVANVDNRADIYSLGIMFYEMLTGQRPAGRVEAPSNSNRQLNESIDEIVLKAMEAEPERRYQQAVNMKTDIEQTARIVHVPAKADKRLVLFALLCVLFLVAVLGVWVGRDYSRGVETILLRFLLSKMPWHRSRNWFRSLELLQKGSVYVFERSEDSAVD